MNRILEIIPTPEDAVVSRVLILVHKAVDEYFPSAESAGRQFTKTVFSDDSNERTVIVPGQINTDPGRAAFRSNEDTLPGSPTKESTRESTRESPTDLTHSTSSALDELSVEGPDWISAILIALLVAGIVVLGTILFGA